MVGGASVGEEVSVHQVVDGIVFEQLGPCGWALFLVGDPSICGVLVPSSKTILLVLGRLIFAELLPIVQTLLLIRSFIFLAEDLPGTDAFLLIGLAELA